MTLPLVAVLAAVNSPIGMYINQYGNKILFLFTALLGIYSVLDLAGLMQKSLILSFWGQNSIIVYATHITILRVMLGTIRIVTGRYLTTDYPLYYITFILLLLIEGPLVLCANAFTPSLFGKTRKRTVKQTDGSG